MKRVVVSVTNDLEHDQRVHKVCLSLKDMGYHVRLVGRSTKSSGIIQRDYSIYRFTMFFNKGPLFYAFYNIRLFILLMKLKADVFHANDLDTLPANYLAAKFRKKKLVYDSHEYFTEVPELVKRPGVRAIWEFIERRIFPKLTNVITVNGSIAGFYSEKYKVPVKVLRNLPLLKKTLELEKYTVSRSVLGLPENKKILLLQGAWINVDRGGEEAIAAMSHLDDVVLLIIGGGDVFQKLKQMSEEPGIKGKVIFKGKMSFNELRNYTRCSDIGLSLDKDTNLNYKYSLPNKIFDYIHCQLPVLASDLPEVSKIVEKFKVGRILKSHDPRELAKKITEMLADQRSLEMYKANCLKARTELCWENDLQVLKSFYS